MGDSEGWPQPSGLLLEGSSPGCSFSSLEDERWSQAENRTLELITRIQPTRSSELRRHAVTEHVQRLIRKCFDCQVFTFGSVPLKTYLPDGDIDLTTFAKFPAPHLKESWANDVRAVLEAEERRKDAEFRVKEVQYIQAEVKIIKCLVENIVVDISFNQLGGLCTLCFLEEVDRLIGRDHLFKRSIILVKAWCYYESRILGAHHGLISTYALETLVLYIFHVFHANFDGPLGVLFRFLEFFSNFDWDKYCISLWGPIPLSALPDMPAEPPRKDGGPLLLTKAFLEGCAREYAVVPNGAALPSRVFSSKYFNVVDPLRTTNNLGRSVSKGNFFRIRNAFSFGAKKLARILDCPLEDVTEELDKFFLNTWDRHGSGKRPDAPDHIERLSGLESPAQGDAEEVEVGRETSALPGELTNALTQHSEEESSSSSGERLRSLALTDMPGFKEVSKARRGEKPDRAAKQQRERVLVVEEPRGSFEPEVVLEHPAAALRPWGNVDVQPFYPRPAPVHVSHPEHEELPAPGSWEASTRGFAPSSIPLQHPLPVPGPPPPPLNLHPASPGFAAQFPMLRGPLPPPLPPYGRPPRVPEGDAQHAEENHRGKDAEDITSRGKKELSPESPVFYEQNGPEEEIRFGSISNGRKDAEEARVKPPEELTLPEGGRVGDGAGPSPEPWPVLDAQLYHQYSQMGPVIYSSQPLPEGTMPAASPSPSPEASSSGSFTRAVPSSSSSSQQLPSIGIPVSPGFLRPEASAGRKQQQQQQQRLVENPSFYYSPFPYMPLYNSIPVYVLPPEEGDSGGVQLHEDGLGFGVSERLTAAGVPVSSVERPAAEQQSGERREKDLLSSDFSHHLRNLDYGRACQTPGPVFLQPAFPPFAKELQGNYIWEGPGRPVQGNLNSRGSRFPRNFRPPPGFGGEDGNHKPRSGTGTYLPGTRQGYRDRQYKSQHEGYQERESHGEREGAPRYPRGMGRGQNHRKTGDKGWHDSNNINNHNINSSNNFHRNPGSQAGGGGGPLLNLEPYAHTAFVNGNGVSPTGPPFILVYPSDPLAQQQMLEFGSLSASSEQAAAAPGRVRGSGTNQQQQPSSPKNKQRASQRSYEMKEEDFPPLSFRGGAGSGGGGSSSASTSNSNRSSPYQTYVASQS